MARAFRRISASTGWALFGQGQRVMTMIITAVLLYPIWYRFWALTMSGTHYKRSTEMLILRCAAASPAHSSASG